MSSIKISVHLNFHICNLYITVLIFDLNYGQSTIILMAIKASLVFVCFYNFQATIIPEKRTKLTGNFIH